MDMKLELVPIPVSDVDRAKSFYAEKVGFNVDLDVKGSGEMREMRVVQLTPPGSACSISIGTGILETPPGSVQALHLVVSDIKAARAELVERGVELGEIQEHARGVSYASFSDPDGNGWLLQQLPY
jgi:predicted enzyme related to lactoylglutathione lyase